MTLINRTVTFNKMKMTVFSVVFLILFSLVNTASATIKVKSTNGEDDVFCQDLIAGKNIDAGDVCLEVVGENLIITYHLTGGWALQGAHLWIGNDLSEMPHNKKGNPIVGHFPYFEGNIGDETSYTFTVPLATLGTNDELCALDQTYVAAHAAVVLHDGEGGYTKEGAWAAGYRMVEQGNWATYLTVEFSCDVTAPSLAITNPVDQSVIGNTLPFITLDYSDEESGVDLNSLNILINGSDHTGLFDILDSGASCQLTTPLDTGTNIISASLSDMAGNVAIIESTIMVSPSSEPLRYIFSLNHNDWIFASSGDGTCVGYLNKSDFGITDIADITALSQPHPDENLFFGLTGLPDIRQSSIDGTHSVYLQNNALGIADTTQIISGHIDLTGTVFFSVEGQPNILQSPGDTTHSIFMENNQIGLSDTDAIGCLYVGYNGTVLFCSPDGQTILESQADDANNTFLTTTDLGVPGSILNAFAMLPETTPPSLSIINPVNGAFLYTTTPAITVNYTDNESGIDVSNFRAKINGIDMTSAFTVTENGASYQVPEDEALPVGANSFEVSVSDYMGNTATETSDFSVGILRALPSATPVTGTAPLTVHFSTDGEDPAGTIQIFRWDFYGDGSWDTYDTVARDYNRTYNNPGTYQAVLYVQSSSGKTATETITITVLNNPPTAAADVLPSNGEVPLTAQLIGTGSDVDGTIVLYEWDFDGDGVFDWSSTSTGTTTHNYTDVGVFNAQFRVTDNSGYTAVAHATTTVIHTGPPGSPTATASASPSTGNAPLNVTFSGSAIDPDNNVVLYEWDFDNDGTYDWSSETTGNTTHTYTTAGTHTASFRVTDATGLTGIDQLLITVNIQTSLSIQTDSIGFLSGSDVTAGASSQYNSSYSAAKAIDGNTSSRWQTARYQAANSWFEVNYNVPQKISSISIRWYDSTNYKMTRARLDAYDSSDNLVYTSEEDFTGSASTVALPDIENVTRLRLTTLAYQSSTYVIINEFSAEKTDMPGVEPTPVGSNITTSISAGSQVTLLIKDDEGNIVRTLVNNESRDLGSYVDHWDCKDDNGIVVTDGAYYAVLQYIVDGQVKSLDLTETTGGTRYSFPISSGCNTRSGSWVENFSPFDDERGAYTFTICSAQEVTFFIGPLYGGTDPTRTRTILNRDPFPAGTHTIYWDGLDDSGNVAQAGSGDSLITGAWRYSMPGNAMVMTGGRPEIEAVTATPNYYSPFSEKCDDQGLGEGVVIDYALTEDVASVQLRVYSLATGSLMRTFITGAASQGENVLFWDGKNNNGEYVDIGDYRIGLVATDAHGNDSLFRYTLVRIDY